MSAIPRISDIPNAGIAQGRPGNLEAALTVIHQIAKDAGWIRALAKRVVARECDGGVARDARSIFELSEELIDLARSFLADSARGEEGDGRPCPIQALLRRAVAVASRAHGDHRVRCELDADAEQIRVNPRIVDVLINLVDNALRASTRDETVLVTLRVQKARLLIAVQDSGCGMSPEVLDSCCKPGFSTRTQRDGSGIGLAISQTIVNSLGGSFAIRSSVGAGTCVAVEIPCLE